MTLGERIYTLRTKCKLSQEELATQIGVSRQSVSKWETDASVPELDKLIKLSEVFMVTLDELVKGDEDILCAKNEAPAEDGQVQLIQGQTNTKKLIGIILLCFGALLLLIASLLSSFLTGLVFCVPFVICGTICLVFEKNVGLWCSWTLFLLVDIYLRFATGISWRLILLTAIYEKSWNYWRLLIGWGEFLVVLALIVITACRFGKRELPLTRRNALLYIAGLVGFGLLFLIAALLPISIVNAFQGLPSMLLDWMKLGLLGALIVATVRIIKTNRLSGIKAFFGELLHLANTE